MRGFILLLAAFAVVGAAGDPGDDPYMKKCNASELTFCDTTLSATVRAKDLVARLTLDEKIQQLSTFSFTSDHGGFTPGVPRLGIPEYDYHTEGLHGVRDSYVAGFTNSTLFPQVTAMAATGNLTLIRRMAEVMGVEFRALNNAMWRQQLVVKRGGGLSVYGPTINIIRDPRWGRAQESVSEDPWFSGAYAKEFIKGVQGDDENYLAVAATCKHLAAYNVEKNRHDYNAVVSDLDMRETYLPAFEACVAAGAAQVMCSYNKVNGLAACLSHDLQTDLLRGEWGFKGNVVADCDAIADVVNVQKAMTGPQATAQGIQAGCDLDCGAFYSIHASDAVSDGLLTESQIDTALQRIFLMRFRLGELGATDEQVPWRSIPSSKVGCQEHSELAMDAASQAVTLLKNDGDLLPLDPSTISTLAVIGPLANSTSVMMGAKDDYNAAAISTVLAGLTSRVSRVVYAAGLASVTDTTTTGFDEARAAAAGADVVVVVLGVDGSVESEGTDRSTVDLPGSQADLLSAVLEVVDIAKVVVVLLNGAAVSCDAVYSNVSAVVEGFEGGQSGGLAVAKVIFGEVNPSGVLPYTVYTKDITNLLNMDDFGMRPNTTTGYPGRTYRFSSVPVLFPFGFGLSYTTFDMQWTDASHLYNVTTGQLHQGVSHRVTVRNTGKRAGAKVVQAFIMQSPDQVREVGLPSAPLKSLYGMQKVFLEPKESIIVTFNTATLPGAAPFATVTASGGRSILPGQIEIKVGILEEEISRRVMVIGEAYGI